MEPGTRTASDALGFGLVGSWVELSPPDDRNAAEFEEFEELRRLVPAVGRGGGTVGSTVPPMLIRDRRTARSVGFVESHSLAGGVAVYVIYLDLTRGRAGFGLEATFLYVSRLFDAGARLVTMEVMSFNRPVIKLLGTAGFQPQARLREHSYSAGRFWDLLIYSFDRADWLRAISRYERNWPGRRPPAALGTRRPS